MRGRGPKPTFDSYKETEFYAKKVVSCIDNISDFDLTIKSNNTVLLKKIADSCGEEANEEFRRKIWSRYTNKGCLLKSFILAELEKKKSCLDENKENVDDAVLEPQRERVKRKANRLDDSAHPNSKKSKVEVETKVPETGATTETEAANLKSLKRKVDQLNQENESEDALNRRSLNLCNKQFKKLKVSEALPEKDNSRPKKKYKKVSKKFSISLLK